jgi:hypothetical protein
LIPPVDPAENNKANVWTALFLAAGRAHSKQIDAKSIDYKVEWSGLPGETVWLNRISIDR